MAAEWAARNRDDSDGIHTRAGEGMAQTSLVAPHSTSTTTMNGQDHSTAAIDSIVAEVEQAENIWKELDLEIMEIQREAAEALSGLEHMQEEIETIGAELRAKDENYIEQIREMEARGNRLEADLRQQLSSLSSEFESYRMRTENERREFLQEANAKQSELRSQITGLQQSLQDRAAQLEQEKLQSAHLRNEKIGLDEELRRQRDEAAARFKKWEERVLAEQSKNAAERAEFQNRLQEIQEEASRRIESSIQKVQLEKQQLEKDYASRLEQVSKDLRTASENLAEAQKIIEDKQRYIETLEPAITNLDEWAHESWLQLNRLQDAVGLPVTPLDENGEIPGVETLEAEAGVLIEHLRSRERSFEDAIFDIQTEMQTKEEDMKEQLTNLEQEYDEYRRDMAKTLDESRGNIELVKKEMQTKLDTMETELQKQRAIVGQESERARAFMTAREGVEKELNDLKKEASYVIDELENQLKREKEARRLEAEKAKEALEKVGEISVQNINRVVAQGRDRIEATEKELSTQVAQTQQELRLSRFASGIFLSVAVTAIVVAGINFQGSRSGVDMGSSKLKPTANIEQTNTDKKSLLGSNKVEDQSALLMKAVQPQSPKELLPTKPSVSSFKNDFTIDTSSSRDFFYAIKEDDSKSKNEKIESSSPGDTASVDKTGRASEAKLPEVEKPTTSVSYVGELVSKDNSGTKQTVAKGEAQIEAKGEAKTETMAETQTKPTAAPVPSPDASTGDRKRSIFAIKEEGAESPSDLAKSEVSDAPVQNKDTNEPAQAKDALKTKSYFAIKEDETDNTIQIAPNKPPSSNTGQIQSLSDGKPRTYLAIKEDTVVTSSEKPFKGFFSIFSSKDSAPQPSPSIPDEALSSNMESNMKDKPTSATADDDTPLIDWEGFTYRWLEEVDNIQSGYAKSRNLPSLTPPETTDEPKQGTDPLNNPLLQQALAPSSSEDPFGSKPSK